MKPEPLSTLNYQPVLPDYLQLPDSYNMKDLLFYVGIAVTSSQLMYEVQSILSVHVFTLYTCRLRNSNCSVIINFCLRFIQRSLSNAYFTTFQRILNPYSEHCTYMHTCTHTHTQGVCGFFQLYFYTLKRDSPEHWKCQPHRFLTRSNEIHEMVVRTINMTIASTVSGILTCWVVNGETVITCSL